MTLDIQRDVPLAPLTTLGLGGAAKHFLRAVDEAELLEALQWAAEEGIASAILGGGSNLIVPDEGYDGLVIQMAMETLELHRGGKLVAGAGVPWEAVVDAALSRDWAGLECLSGIPGSAGATPIQNVGAYGQEVSEVIDAVRVLRRSDLVFAELSAEDCGFCYRDSLFKREPERFVVTAVRFALRPGAPATTRYAELARRVAAHASLADVRSAVLELRRSKSMLLDPADPNHRSAGSFFLNPIVSTEEADRVVAQAVAEKLAVRPEDVPRYPADDGRTKLAAGWLVEKAGIAKGARRGAIGVSSRHALALVHHGGGTTAELLSFADEIRQRVHDRFGVRLEREPRLLA